MTQIFPVHNPGAHNVIKYSKIDYKGNVKNWPINAKNLLGFFVWMFIKFKIK